MKVVICFQNIYVLMCHGGLHDVVLQISFSSYVMLYKPEIICAVGLSSYVIENELFVSMGCMCYNNGLYVVCAIIIG